MGALRGLDDCCRPPTADSSQARLIHKEMSVSETWSSVMPLTSLSVLIRISKAPSYEPRRSKFTAKDPVPEEGVEDEDEDVDVDGDDEGDEENAAPTPAAQ